MNEHREGEQFLRFARTKGCSPPFNWLLINLIEFIIAYQNVAGLKMHTGNLCYSKYDYEVTNNVYTIL
jgi:hypothetical protein